jgi:uncharacterized membrane protein YgdD (TMEM256/DUF423 family)
VIWIWIAGISGALAVGCGAFGAHALRGSVSPERVDAWMTASHYQLLHSVALLALALFAVYAGKTIRLPALLMTLGILLFSGSIYLLVLTEQRWLGPVTPLGGICLILAWLSLLTLTSD